MHACLCVWAVVAEEKKYSVAVVIGGGGDSSSGCRDGYCLNGVWREFVVIDIRS